MRIIEPTRISPAMLLYSSVAEDDAPEWDELTAYTEGQRVIAGHRVYEALRDNTGMAPAESVEDWLDAGATAPWRMFDDKVGTVSSGDGVIEVTIAPGLANALALLNIDAAAAMVVMTDPVDGVVFEQTYELNDPTGITDWWPYFFEPIRRRRDLVAWGLPSYSAATITITLESSEDAEVRLGELVVGRGHQFAAAFNYGASVGIQDYSRKGTDEWGNAQIVERPYARRGRWPFEVLRNDTDRLVQVLSRLRATPAVYIGSEWYGAAMIYGWYRDFDVVISRPMSNDCVIELEGLT